MPRIRNRRALGSVSFLFMAVIVPLLMVFVCLGAELTHFFGAHDDLQRIVDRATRASLTKGLSEEETEEILHRELAPFSALVEVQSVQHRKSARVSDTQVDASFRGTFSELVARLVGSSSPLLPVHVSARVRKVEARALVVLDRTSTRGATACGDGGLETVSGFVDRVGAALLRSGVSSVSVAVVPGASRPAELLSAEASADLFVRCRDRQPNVPFDALSLAGSSDGLPAEAVAAEVLNLVHSELLGGPAEARSVVFVGQGSNEAQRGYGAAIFGALNTDMQQRSLLVGGTYVVLGGLEAAPITLSRGGEFGVDLRTVRATEREISHPNLLAAVRGRVGERTVLVF